MSQLIDGVILYYVGLTLLFGLPIFYAALHLIFLYPAKNPDLARVFSGFCSGLVFGKDIGSLLVLIFTKPATVNGLVAIIAWPLMMFLCGSILALFVGSYVTWPLALTIVAGGVPALLLSNLFGIVNIALSPHPSSLPSPGEVFLSLVIVSGGSLVTGYFLQSKVTSHKSDYFLISTISWGALAIQLALPSYLSPFGITFTRGVPWISALLAYLAINGLPLALATLGFFSQNKLRSKP